MNHDQNFKNLILDYPRQALEFFAAAEAGPLEVVETALITPVRREQLRERLGERFRELDTPLRVKWPDGRRAALLLFVVEEETQPGRFSIHRLAHYCLDLVELLDSEWVVPVVIFLRSGRIAMSHGWAGKPAFPPTRRCRPTGTPVSNKKEANEVPPRN